MLDDINSELLSIYPGNFPNPRPFSRKPLIFNSGFHAYVRPPLPLYRIQCNNDYIAEKSKKAEAAIRKLYKAAATTSSATFKEANTVFQHDLTTEAMLVKYRDTQIYSKSRLRKVNKRQLLKAAALAKKKDDDESKKYDVSISKIDLQASPSREKLKQKIAGALRFESKRWRNKNRASSAAEDDKTSKSETEMMVPKPSTYPNNEVRTKAETESLKQKGPLTLRRPMLVKKSCDLMNKKKAEFVRDALPNSTPNCLLKDEEEEEGEERKPLKEGNYTKIVTFKKKTLFNSATSAELSSFPFSEQTSGKYRGASQKVPMLKETGNNEIDHLYKINELDASLEAQANTSRQVNLVAKKSTLSDSKLEQMTQKMGEPQEINGPDWSTAKLMEKSQFKKDLMAKYGVGQTVTEAPHGLQAKGTKAQAPCRIPVIEGSDIAEFKANRYRLRKPAKREEKCLFLPKVTPILGIDPPQLGQGRKNTLRLGVIPFGTKSEVTFVNFR